MLLLASAEVYFRTFLEDLVITHLAPPISMVRIILIYQQDGSLFTATLADM